MIQDKNRGISITYNYLNLPVTISWNVNDLNDKRKIEWLYDAAGSKLRKTVYNADGEATMVTDYVNGFVYNTNFGDALPQLSFFSMSEGRVVNLSGSYELQYWLKDHLGNTRVAFRNNAGTPEVLQKDFYYPFGLNFKFGTQVGDENKFKFNGKELEDEHGLYWYHYGARYYDPQIGRWHTMDFADQFHSPYLFVRNNPMNYIDPNGCYDDYFQGEDGSIIWSPSTASELTINGQLFHNIGENFISTGGMLGRDAIIFHQNEAKLILTPKYDYNWTKVFTATLLYSRSAYLFAASIENATKAMLSSETAIGTVGFGVLSFYQLRGSSTRLFKANKILGEAFNESLNDANIKNLNGFLLMGDKYDDPNEPSMIEYFNSRTGTPQKNWDFIKEVLWLGAF